MEPQVLDGLAVGFVEGIDNSRSRREPGATATVGTDTGHQGRGVEATWALDNIERQLNFGHAAVHRVAEASKAIIRARYSARRHARISTAARTAAARR
jgi:hypothetical protein